MPLRFDISLFTNKVGLTRRGQLRSRGMFVCFFFFFFFFFIFYLFIFLFIFFFVGFVKTQERLYLVKRTFKQVYE